MRVLLDTHTFLWWNLNAPELSETARECIADEQNEIFVSAATAWEIGIKYGQGRLELPEPPDQYIATRLHMHHFTALPVQISHAAAVYQLPDIHKDPFDRLLVVQSQLENMPLLTADPEIAKYSVSVIW
ncbi:MAG: type II toxin-antitoxin system VapC family toxin [Ardenticatenaceae bacterium]|nr:type II toxin-antitoxin system VapC family toxin [Ardenticatenaceae bacterium]